MDIIRVLKRLAEHNEIMTWNLPALRVILNPTDCASARLLLWLMDQEPDATVGELLDTLTTAHWWLYSLTAVQNGERHKAAETPPPAPAPPPADERITCPACGGSRHIVETVHLGEPIECFVCQDGMVTQEVAEHWRREDGAYDEGQEP